MGIMQGLQGQAILIRSVPIKVRPFPETIEYKEVVVFVVTL